jgi:hypothetical protein
MYLFTINVDNEYTAKKLTKATAKLGFRMLYQWVRTQSGKDVIACDFHTPE